MCSNNEFTLDLDTENINQLLKLINPPSPDNDNNSNNGIAVNNEKALITTSANVSEPSSVKENSVQVKQEPLLDKDASSDDQFDLDSEEGFKRQRKRVEKKVDSFFDKICKKTFASMQGEEIYSTNTIHYGNLTNKYDAKVGQTSVEKTELLQVDEEPAGRSTQGSDASMDLLKFITANKMTNSDLSSSYKANSALKDFNLVRKTSIIYLIERNREYKVYCPFDEIAYRKFQKKEFQIKRSGKPECDILMFDENVTSDIELRLCNQEEIKEFLIPNCLSTYLMPFFFDIFQPSELKQFSSRTVDILLKLKNSYKPQLHLSDVKLDSIFTGQLVENCLWNCFALLKFKFSSKYKFGFLNYFISLCCFLKHLEMKNSEEYKAKVVCYKKVIGYYIDALLLNGFIQLKDLKFVYEFMAKDKWVNKKYFDDVMHILVSVMKQHFPMKLKNLCRIEVKRGLCAFDYTTVKSLGLSSRDENFLLFNSEFERYYDEIQAILAT